MANAFWGGGGYKIFFRMTADHTDLANKTTGVALGVAPVLGTDEAYVLVDDDANDIIVEQSQFQFDEEGVGTFTFTTTDGSQEMLDFLDIAAPLKKSTATTERPTLNSEAAVEIGGNAATSDVPYLVISAGASDGVNRMTDIAVVTFSRTSLSTSTTFNEIVKYSLTATTVACKKTGGFIVDQAAFSTTYWNATIAAGLRTIGEDYYAKRSLIPIP